MNRERREQLKKAQALLQQAKEILAEVGGMEEEAFDNMPEAFQEGERGEKMQEYIDTMDEAIGELDDLTETLEEVIFG